MDLSRRTPKYSINDVLINEWKSSSRCLCYAAMYQNLLMNCFIIDQESMRFILEELDPLGVEQRPQHSLTRCTYISVGPNPTYHVDGYKSKPLGFALHGAIDGSSWKILWLFVGSSNNDPKLIILSTVSLT